MGNKHYIIRDLKANKTINITLFLFVCLSAWLMASGGLVIERLTGALKDIENIAAPPHYLQMHVGAYDEDEIQAFSDGTGMVEHVAIQRMFNVEGINLVHDQAFSDSLLDNYFVVQNKAFDYLLDTENRIAEVAPGEIGIPVVYAKKYGVTVGDTLTVHVGDVSKAFRVKTVVRDAQMGSSLASSIRLLIHETDFNTLYPHATKQEVIIGFRLLDEANINAFSDLYNAETSHMPKNGVGITLPLIQLLNGIGDGLMSGLILLVSVLFMVIAILNIRLVLLSTLEQEAREIGALRAIGLSQKEVAHLYKIKFRALAFVACGLAVCMAFFTSNVMLKNISLNFGLSEVTVWTYLIPVMAVSLVYMGIMLAVRLILKRIGKMSIVSALTEGQMIREKQAKPIKFWHAWHDANWSLSFHEYRTQFKSWLLFIVVFFLLTLVILLPLNLNMTMNEKAFAEYVGAAKSDVRIAIEHQTTVQMQLKQVEDTLMSDLATDKWALYQTVQAELSTPSGMNSFLIETGDYNAFPIHMQEGRLPLNKREMALSVLNAKRLERRIGDTLSLGNGETYEIVGIYQDITNGGLTSKVATLTSPLPVKQSVYYVNFKQGANKAQMVKKWSEAFKFAKVIPVEVLIDQTLGTITASLKVSVVVIITLSSLIAGLISVLTIHLKQVKNRSKDAALLAIGFSALDVRKLYWVQAGFSIVLGTCLGAVVSLSLGESLVSGLLGMMNFGMTQVTFLIQPMAFVVLGLLMPMAIGFVCTGLTTLKTTNRVRLE